MESLQILVSIICLLFSMVLISISAGISVHVHHHVQDVSPESLPDELNATIVDESGTATFLQLQRAKHIVPNVPVYTLNVDNEGKYVTRREILQKTQNVGYYQDVSAGAALQVKRIEASEGKSNHFILTGELSIAGQNYKLEYGPSPGKRETGAAPSSEYSLEPIKAVSASEIDFIKPPTETLKPREKDVFFQTSATGHTPSATSRVQRQRSGPTDVYIDLVAVADYKVYKRFRSESRPKDEDLKSLREYFSFIANGIGMRYRSIKSSKFTFHVSLVRLIISETAAASSFTENYKTVYKGVEVVDSSESLAAFAEFIDGAGKDVIVPRDYALLFTGYDLFSRTDTGKISTDVAGLAYMRTLCQADKFASSINEDWGDYHSVPVSAHEVGHSLGSEHDGSENSCSGTNGYLMNPALDSANLNSYFFSDCSVGYFEQYISSQLSDEIGQKCFLEQLPVSPDIPDVSDRLPGQENSVDKQCRMFVGNGSSFCRGLISASEICLSLYCDLPDGASSCRAYQALPGTTCGNGKMCLNGQCLSDPRAPAVDDDCLFGDNPGVAFNDQTCEQLISSFTAYCYQSNVKKSCCASCKKAYRKLKGCEYGDTVRGCNSLMCNDDTFRQMCCGTCNYGTPLLESVNTRAAAFVHKHQSETVHPQ